MTGEIRLGLHREIDRVVRQHVDKHGNPSTDRIVGERLWPPVVTMWGMGVSRSPAHRLLPSLDRYELS